MSKFENLSEVVTDLMEVEALAMSKMNKYSPKGADIPFDDEALWLFTEIVKSVHEQIKATYK